MARGVPSLRVIAAGVVGALAAGKKPLFDYDDHFVMLNDHGRNEFYARALQRALEASGPGGTVLDVGAGSGLLSMLAATVPSGVPAHVVALEANPALAALAERTIARNQKSFRECNVTVIAALSSRVELLSLPAGRRADVLVTETFGTMLLGEGAINFVPDARDRLLKEGGTMIPAGGCQYATLVEAPSRASTLGPGAWGGLNLTRLEALQDTVYWKATLGASNSPLVRLSDRICVLEVDFYKDTKDSVPLNRTFKLRATRSGTVHAVLLDWDIWADPARTEILSTAPGSRNFAGDVAWGHLLQFQEMVGEDWMFSNWPSRLRVEAGESLELGVEFIARGISLHARIRRDLAASGRSDIADAGLADSVLPSRLGSPARIRGVDRGDMVEANELYLPIAGDSERHSFYRHALQKALRVDEATPDKRKPTLLDCSSGAGIPALLAAKAGHPSLVLTRRKEFAKVLRGMAKDNNVSDFLDAYQLDPQELLESLLPDGAKVDVVVVDPPGTPTPGLSPFAILPSIRKRLAREDARVIPSGGCFQVRLVESEDLATLFTVPGGLWNGLDLTVFNEEAVQQGLLQRLVPMTKRFGPESTMGFNWLSEPRCIFEVDLNTYGMVPGPTELRTLETLKILSKGKVHALVGVWVVWDDGDQRALLDSESGYLGRSLSWPTYVQPVAVEALLPSVIEPVVVLEGQQVELEVIVRQGAGKVTGMAGPELSLRLLTATAAADAGFSGSRGRRAADESDLTEL